MKREAEKKNPPAPIRDQRNQIQSYIEKEMEEIQRLEEESETAYRQNKPGLAHQLQVRAGIRRQELKEFQEKRSRQ